MLSLLVLSLSAQADIAAPRLVQESPVTHQLRVDNLEQHPDYALLVYDQGPELLTHLQFSADTLQIQTLFAPRVEGANRLDAPSFFLMPKEAALAWEAAAKKALAEPEPEPAPDSDCDSPLGCLGTLSGGGFGGVGFGGTDIDLSGPRYPAPEGAIPCGVSVDVVRRSGTGEVDTLIEVARLTKAAPDMCTVRIFGKERRLAGEVVGRAYPVGIGASSDEPATPALPEAEPEVPEEPAGSGGCATAANTASLGSGLLLLGMLGWRRRAGRS